jgi:beta-lactamase regulating signal transducer with metallopeptidase domain
MTDILLQIGVSKLIISLGLAGVAWSIQRWRNQPFLSHPLWFLVLATLVLPSVVTVPVVDLPWIDASGFLATDAAVLDSGRMALQDGGTLEAALMAFLAENGRQGLILLWLLGSAIVLLWSLVRVRRFNALLRTASSQAPQEFQELASDISRKLGLATTPTILTTNAQLSPMVWWIGGKVRVVVPAVLLADADPQEVRWILAHELAHIRRRDHMVRWIEWVACVSFWWNPVAWWTRRNLRANEELCCDELVLNGFSPNPRSYANAILTVLDVLSTPPTLRPPAFASEADSGGRLDLIERRLKLIISGDSRARAPRSVRNTLRLAVLAVLPLGLVHCGSDDGTGSLDPDLTVVEAPTSDLEAVSKPYLTRIDEMVASGKTSAQDAARMRATIQGMNDRVRAGIESGEFTLEDVKPRMEGTFKGVFSPLAEGSAEGAEAASDPLRARLAAEGERLKAAVDAGKMTEEEAVAEYKQFEQRMRLRMGGSEGR